MKTLTSLMVASLRRLTELCMAALALLTLADVLGRYLFNISIMGAVELTEILMVGVIFCGIILATVKREHVVVDLLPIPFGKTAACIAHVGTQLLAAGISALLAVVSWSQAESARDYGDQTTMLGLSLAPVVYFMSIMLFINTIVQLSLLWQDLRLGRTHD